MDIAQVRSMVTLFSVFSPIIPLIAGSRKKTLLWYYVLTGLFFDLTISFVLKQPGRSDHLAAANIFLVIEFLLISRYYKDVLYTKATVPYYYWVTTVITVLFICHTLYNNVSKYNGLGSAVLFFSVILFYGILGFYKILKEQKIMFLTRSSFFWINVAFVIYSSGCFIVFAFFNYPMLQQHKNVLAGLYMIHDFLNVCKNCFLGMGLYLISRESGRIN